MEITNFLLLVVESVIYFCVMVTLLEFRHRVGIGVFITAFGVLHFLEIYLASSVVIALPLGIVTPVSAFLFSGKLMLLLLLYVKEDAATIRQPIYGLLAGNFLLIVLSLFLRFHQAIPGADGQVSDISIITEMGWLMVWGTALLFVDALIMILLYERLGRYLRNYVAMRFVVCGMITLSFDQIGFYLVLQWLYNAPISVFFGGWVAKMVAACLFALMIRIYFSMQISLRDEISLGPRKAADVFNTLTFRERYEDLLLNSGTDRLTGVLDRNSFDVVASVDLQRTLTAGKSLVLMILDVDHFKSVNDRFGHPEGDRVLRELASQLRARLRDTDAIYRYGGEEFVIISENMSNTDGAHLAEQLRQIVEQNVTTKNSEKITVSIGVAGAPLNGRTITALLAYADKKLYQAKNAGRNRIAV